MDRQISQLPPRGSLAGAEPIRTGYRTDKGRRRSNNEDSYAVFTGDELNPDPEASRSALPRSVVSPGLDAFLIVADGMGGTKGGEMASNIVVNSLGEIVRNLRLGHTSPASAHFADLAGETIALHGEQTKEQNKEQNKNQYKKQNREQDEVATLLHNSLIQANSAVWRAKQQRADLAQMGTTCVTAMLCRGTLTIGNVGDSRAYLLRRGQLRQLTEDHSEVWEQVKAGRMTPQQAASSRFRNTITRAMGLGPEVTPDIASLPLESGDLLLLCSDGLTTELDDRTLAHLLSQSDTPQQAADQLVAAALEHGGSDNVTVVVLHYGHFVPLAPETISVMESVAVQQTPLHPRVQRNHTGGTNVKVEGKVEGVLNGSGYRDARMSNQMEANPVDGGRIELGRIDKDRIEQIRAEDIASDEEDVTDPNQVWKRSLQSFDKFDKSDRSDRHPDSLTQALSRSRQERERAAMEWEKGRRPSGVSPLLFGLIALVALGEAVFLGMLFAGVVRLPNRAPAPVPAIKPLAFRATDGPLKYEPPVRISTRKDLWEGLLLAMPDGRLLVMTAQGDELAITPGGTVAKLPRTSARPPASVGETQARGKTSHRQTGESTESAGATISNKTARLAVALDASGNRYELNPTTRAIDKYDPSGTSLLPGIGKGKLKFPVNLTVDSSGDLYVIDNCQLMRLHAVPDTGTSSTDERSVPASK